MADKKDLRFNSPQELADILNGLGLVLHQRNRVTGESNYVWHVAELIRAAGKLCLPISAPGEAENAFGDGYAPGKLSKAAQLDLLTRLLRAHLDDAQPGKGKRSGGGLSRNPDDPVVL